MSIHLGQNETILFLKRFIIFLRGEIFLKIFVFLRGHISKRKKTLALKWLKLRIPKDDLLIALILLFMPSHIALLYVLLPNFINELQISSYQF